MKGFYKGSSVLWIMLGIMLMMSACSSGMKSSEDMADNSPTESEAKVESTKESQNVGNKFGSIETDKADVKLSFSEKLKEDEGDDLEIAGHEPKLIVTSNIEIETKEYDQAVSFVEKKVASLSGYIEESNIKGKRPSDNHYGGRRAEFRLRIPKKFVDKFLESLEDDELGYIISKQRYTKDVTDSYFDTESRVKTRLVQEKTLLDILEKADKLDNVLGLVREIADVRYEIDTMTSQIKKWDSLISYSTINLEIYEVKTVVRKIEDPNLAERIWNEFMRSVRELKNFGENLLIFIVGAIPYLIFIIPIGFILYKVIKKEYIKRKKKDNTTTDES